VQRAGRTLPNEPGDVSSARHPFFGIITIPTSLCRGGNGDDRFSEVYRARQTSEKVHVDPPESNLSESEAPTYIRNAKSGLLLTLIALFAQMGEAAVHLALGPRW
jgi:hypothetical protein